MQGKFSSMILLSRQLNTLMKNNKKQKIFSLAAKFFMRHKLIADAKLQNLKDNDVRIA